MEEVETTSKLFFFRISWSPLLTVSAIPPFVFGFFNQNQSYFISDVAYFILKARFHLLTPLTPELKDLKRRGGRFSERKIWNVYISRALMRSVSFKQTGLRTLGERLGLNLWVKVSIIAAIKRPFFAFLMTVFLIPFCFKSSHRQAGGVRVSARWHQSEDRLADRSRGRVVFILEKVACECSPEQPVQLGLRNVLQL